MGDDENASAISSYSLSYWLSRWLSYWLSYWLRYPAPPDQKPLHTHDFDAKKHAADRNNIDRRR